MDLRTHEIPGTADLVGVDIGSLFFKVVAAGRDGQPVFRHKEPHRGDPRLVLDRFLDLPWLRDRKVGISGFAAQEARHAGFDPVVCLHSAVRFRYPSARNILEVGASHLVLVRLDDEGRIASIHRNSLCASGTGSFLDAQAARMGIEYGGSKSNARFADPPPIATRCAVFAKSDLIYRQQEGVPKEALWSGLCRGLASSLIHALTRGRTLSGLTVLCGGVALNETLVEWLRHRLAEISTRTDLVVMPHPEFAVSWGAALLARAGEGGLPSADPLPVGAGARKKRPELKLELSQHPGGSAFRPEKDREGNEVTLHRVPWSSGSAGAVDVHLGIDIGSTSTKLVLVDADGRILLDIYRPTGADPVAAVWRLFDAVSAASREAGLRFAVRGAATTGSGRKLIGSLIGADLVVNEITAHLAGAVHIDPTVETIFEIGGQDAKYMSVRDGGIADANMNYVCAAGTGSFIEEQAAKLGYTVDEIGEAALGTSPPYTSTRCTVFMEQDVLDLLNQGVSRREAAGAVMYSVIDNYLEQVVGSRPVNGRRVFFQGATARNRGLVAAIEKTLGVEVVVSPFCHVLGAYGAALLAMKSGTGGDSRFRGFDLGRRGISIREEVCGLCSNECRLSRADIEGELDRPVWGMKCGREGQDPKRRDFAEYALFQKAVRMGGGTARTAVAVGTGPVVRLPRALTMYSDYPFWKAFFEALGISAHLGPPVSRRSLDLGRTFSGPDFCLPLKAAVGQAAALLYENDGAPVFLPFILADYASEHFSHSRLCPYVEILPTIARTALGGDGLDLTRLISPVVDLRLSDELNARSLVTALSPAFPVRQREAERALGLAHEARRNHEAALLAEGRAALRRVRPGGKPAVVVVGRPYSIMDALLNHDVPRAVARCGIETIPMTCLDQDPESLQGEFRNLFWSYGQRILSSLCQIARTEGLYAVFISNFGCGPDSFLLSYAEAVMGDKPLLILEIDEHGAAGGYETRIEAFIEVILRDWERRKGHRGRRAPLEEPAAASDIRERTLWFPQMHPVVNRFFVAAFRSEGYDARTLPLEDESTHSLGKKWTRGAECLPMSLTLGAFLNQVESDRRAGEGAGDHPALFLPTSTGPCRYGQYRTLDRLIFERLKMEDVPILSPGAHNAYYGLPGRLRRRAWEGICGGDLLFKMRCRVLPYETTKGDTEEVLEQACRRAEDLVVSKRMDWPAFLEEAMADFLRIPVRPRSRPLVGIVGEIYVRCNPFANSRIVDTVEKLGGEVWLSPASEWILYTAWVELYLARRQGSGPLKSLPLALKWRYFTGTEKAMTRRLGPVLGDRAEPSMDEIMRAGGALLPPEFQGESIVTVGRAILFGEAGADLVVNCAPFGCMHGNITSAIFEQSGNRTRVPVVNVSYDGTGDNAVLNAFMHEARRRKG